ncbi:MAG: sodium:solute symporter [Planctomycetes bacterium]|nr:sodium:solute symporter [Planctomycetota bacterium]
MAEHFGIYSLLPPLFAIGLSIVTRQVFLSLAVGIWVGYLTIARGDAFAATTQTLAAFVGVFQNVGNTRTILFCLMVGSLITLIQRSGGVDGFVHWVQSLGIVRSKRSAGLLAVAVGVGVFIETSMSSLVTGTVARPIFDRLKISREKLAYVCDTASAPICILIPLNGWGAYVIAQLAGLDVSDPVHLLIQSIPYNFYAILSIALLIGVIVSGKDFGPMREAERRAREEGKLLADGARPMVTEDVLAMPRAESTPSRVINMVVPILGMIVIVLSAIVYTGYQKLPDDLPNEFKPMFWAILKNCSGSTAVYWGVFGGCLIAIAMYLVQGIMGVKESVDVALKGAGALVPLAVLMILAFALGSLCGKDGLNTGGFVASLVSRDLSATLVAPLAFIAAGAIAFTTGTSWGTFAIMLPIALSVAAKVELPPELAVAAVLGGGVFGDHCSPISDTTIVASMASASDHIDHVRTQLPYALAVGFVSTLLYAICGAMMA